MQCDRCKKLNTKECKWLIDGKTFYLSPFSCKDFLDKIYRCTKCHSPVEPWDYWAKSTEPSQYFCQKCTIIHKKGDVMYRMVSITDNRQCKDCDKFKREDCGHITGEEVNVCPQFTNDFQKALAVYEMYGKRHYIIGSISSALYMEHPCITEPFTKETLDYLKRISKQSSFKWLKTPQFDWCIAPIGEEEGFGIYDTLQMRHNARLINLHPDLKGMFPALKPKSNIELAAEEIVNKFVLPGRTFHADFTPKDITWSVQSIIEKRMR